MAESPDMIKNSAELDAASRRWIRALFTADEQTLVNLYSTSDAAAYIGTDPDEDWAGSEVGTAVAAHASQIREQIGWKIEIDTVEAFEHGEGGWSTVKGTVIVGEYDPLPFRSTQSWALESGMWKIVHNHNSVGVSNQAAVGVTLTSSLSELLGSGQGGADADIRANFTAGIVTIMFTDIVDSSGWLSQLGDEAWVGIVAWHDDAVRQIVERHSGSVVKTLGDGTMTAFDSTRNAAHAAIEIQRSVMAGGAGAAIGVRIGLHVGEVQQSRDYYLGQAVHKAARIASAAAGNEIMISSTLQALLMDSGEFDFGSSMDAEFKGFQGTHTVIPLLWSET